jgi:hypothetical protein
VPPRENNFKLQDAGVPSANKGAEATMTRHLRGLLIGLFALAAVPALSQTPPRILVVGKDVKPGDHVTAAAGVQQALLSPDGASLVVGPDSDVVLDKFQYDPAAKSGELALTVLSGSLRVGGGAIMKAEDVTVAAGASVVKVHNATAAIGVRPQGAEIRMPVGERVAVTAEGATQTMTQPDSVIIVPTGKPPSAPSSRTAGAARPDGWASAFSDLDTMTRTTNRIIENSSQAPRIQTTPAR